MRKKRRSQEPEGGIREKIVAELHILAPRMTTPCTTRHRQPIHMLYKAVQFAIVLFSSGLLKVDRSVLGVRPVSPVRSGWQPANPPLGPQIEIMS